MQLQRPIVTRRSPHPRLLEPPSIEGSAGAVGGEMLVDTGAFGAMIDLEVADRLSLPMLGLKELHGIHDYGTVRCYQAKLVLPAKDSIGEDCKFIKSIECVGV